MSTTIDFGTMTETDLRKSLRIAFLAPMAEAEIARREEQAEAINALAVESAHTALTAMGFDVTDTVSLVVSYVRIKGGAVNWYELDDTTMPAPLAALRDNLAVAIKAAGVPMEANARKVWLASNR